MQRQIYEYDELIGYRYIGGVTVRIPHEGGGFILTTNEAGLRCKHELTKEMPPGSYRVLLFGDSLTGGDGVSNQFRFGDLLEERFPRLQILNFGLSGTGTDQQYLIFREYGKRLDYDLLMICPPVENIRRVASRYRLVKSRADGKSGYQPKPYFELVDGQLALHHSPVPKDVLEEGELPQENLEYVDVGGPRKAARTFVNTYLRPLKSVIQRASRYQPVPEYDRPDNPAWLLMKAILTQWVSESGDHPVLVCPIPMYQHVEQTASAENYQRRFQELGGLDRVAVYDPLPRFWAETPEARRKMRFARDPHLTVYGHQVMADALAPAISSPLDSS